MVDALDQRTTEKAPHIAALNDERLRKARVWLEGYRERDSTNAQLPSRLRADLACIKGAAVSAGNERLAKAAWCLESAASVQRHYLAAFEHMRESEFYKAWCELERAEVEVLFLDRHLRDPSNVFGLELIRKQIQSFQNVYPYQLFLSPEIWEKEIRCTICDSRITPRSACGHESGEVYGGEPCLRRVTSAALLSVSIVRTPVQKYSVLYPADPATSGLAANTDVHPIVQYIVDRLATPWVRFRHQWTKQRHSHERYREVPPDAPCPCVAPTGTYAECCGPTEGVLRPHVVVEFEQEPPKELQSTLFT
jgi:hypothetical protein